MPNRRSMFGAFGRKRGPGVTNDAPELSVSRAPPYPVGPGAFLAPRGIGPEPLISERVGVPRRYEPSYAVGPGAFIDPGLANNSVDQEPWRSPTDTGRMGVGDVARVGGFAPPSLAAPDTPDTPDDIAYREAVLAAQRSIRDEGAPYFRSPSVVNAGDALASAVDANRAAQAEMARREGVSWEDWWRFHGRQGEASAAPFDLQNAYRPGRAPPRFGAQSRRPGPR
jgi:hypothetical protein